MIMGVTGGTGCLGLPLIKRFTDIGLKIKLLTLPDDPHKSLVPKNVKIIVGDILCLETLRSFTRNCDIVFHLAAKVHANAKCKKEEKSFYDINVEGTRLLLQTASSKKVKRIIFFSTVGIYGKDADFYGNELSPCKPTSVYARSKYLAEQLVLDAHKNGGPEGVVLRFPVVYGPLDRGNMAGLIKAIYHKQFFYFGDGKAYRSMISSENTAEAALRAAFEPRAANQIFCATDGRDYTMREVVEAICEALDTDWRPCHVPLFIAKILGKSGDLIERLACTTMPINSDRVRKLSRPLTFSCDKAKRILKYEPIETLQAGIFKEVKWLLTENGWK